MAFDYSSVLQTRIRAFRSWTPDSQAAQMHPPGLMWRRNQYPSREFGNGTIGSYSILSILRASGTLQVQLFVGRSQRRSFGVGEKIQVTSGNHTAARNDSCFDLWINRTTVSFVQPPFVISENYSAAKDIISQMVQEGENVNSQWLVERRHLIRTVDHGSQNLHHACLACTAKGITCHLTVASTLHARAVTVFEGAQAVLDMRVTATHHFRVRKTPMFKWQKRHHRRVVFRGGRSSNTSTLAKR
ncbi:hypothetical protein COOONC_27847 [Cooperia oncophora]